MNFKHHFHQCYPNKYAKFEISLILLYAADIMLNNTCNTASKGISFWIQKFWFVHLVLSFWHGNRECRNCPSSPSRTSSAFSLTIPKIPICYVHPMHTWIRTTGRSNIKLNCTIWVVNHQFGSPTISLDKFDHVIHSHKFSGQLLWVLQKGNGWVGLSSRPTLTDFLGFGAGIDL